MQIPVHKINDQAIFIKWRNILIDPLDVETAHRHDYYHIMLLRKVIGIHEIDFENYDCKNYSIHFVGKGRVHKVSFQPNVIGEAILFSEEIFDSSDADKKLLSSLGFFKTDSYPVLNLKKEKFEQLSALAAQTKKASTLSNFDTGKYLLFALLSEIRETYNLQSKNVSKKKSAEEIILLNQYLQTHAKTANDLSQFLQQHGISTLRINTLCKKEFGKTALQLLHDRKLLEVKRLLVYTDMQIKQIAYECGFEDIAYFNRYFKKFTNQTPNSFRNSH